MASGGGGMGVAIVGLIELVIFVAFVAGLWKVFAKAGQPGWAAIVPIYNIVVMLQIAKKPVWWIILFFIPIVNLVIGILVAVEIAKRFNLGVGFAVGMLLLPFIFYPMLGFGSATYQGSA
jgi:hypothetical protein